MLDSINRKASDGEIDQLSEFLHSDSIPYSLAHFASSGAKFRAIRFSSGDRTLEVQILPDAVTHTVNSDEALELDAYAVVMDIQDKSAGLISNRESVEFLPELRQAYHEGESFMERVADYRYHFRDCETEIAAYATDPVQRLDDPITIKAVQFLGGVAPKKWLLETSSGDGLYLRVRSGSIRLYDEVDGGEEIFNAYIGREHPGTSLYSGESSDYEPLQDEVIRIVTAVNYINITEDPDTEVSEEIYDEYAERRAEMFDDMPIIDEDFYDETDIFLEDEE